MSLSDFLINIWWTIRMFIVHKILYWCDSAWGRPLVGVENLQDFNMTVFHWVFILLLLVIDTEWFCTNALHKRTFLVKALSCYSYHSYNDGFFPHIADVSHLSTMSQKSFHLFYQVSTGLRWATCAACKWILIQNCSSAYSTEVKGPLKQNVKQIHYCAR
jgi:hypothetical protein